MKLALSTIIIFSFISIAVFGVFAMAHSMDREHGGCIAATSKGEACPGVRNALQTITYHLNSFKSFSTATTGNNLVNALLLLFVLSLVAGFWVFRDTEPTQPIFTTHQSNRQLFESRAFSLQRELIRWISLHENSPAYL